MESADLDVSIILPVYNEGGHVREEIERMRAAMDGSALRYEIIAIDDGSTDQSYELLREIDGIKLIRFRRNRGSGSARRAGTAAARGRTIVWTDVDMTYPNDAIPQLVKELEGFDQIVGARTSERGTHRRARSIAKRAIRWLASYLVQEEIPDLNSGFRAFRRDVGAQFLHLLPRGFSCVTTLTMTFLSNGYSVKYIPIEYSGRAGKSKFHWWLDTRRYVTQVLRLILSYEPLRVFVPLGFGLAALGVGKLAYDWTTRDFHLATNTLLILFAAMQLFTIGFVADLVVQRTKMRDEVEPASQHS